MQLKALTGAILLASLPATSLFAAALDRSGQSISAFLQPGNYFEAGMSVLDADVSGQLREGWSAAGKPSATDLSGTKLSDMAESYHFVNAAIKVQMTDQLSFGLIYDQPFGAKAAYSTDDARHAGNKVSNIDKNGAFHNGNDEATEVDVQTQNLNFIFGYQPTENWNIYGGAVYQTVKGDVQLRGTAYGPFGAAFCVTQPMALCFKSNGYNAKISEDSAVGWLAGVAYQIPEIALKASLTYRAEIDHSMEVEEQVPLLALAGLNEAFYGSGTTSFSTPQSVNLDFQSGIMANTVAFAQIRWVDWSNFSIKPYKFGKLADKLHDLGSAPSKFDLVAYEKDQISATVGVGRKFSDKWAASTMVSWDSGAGNPVSTLGPTEGYWGLGVGAQYSPTPSSFIQAGVKYFWLGDAKSQVASDFGTDAYAAEFKDNDAIGYSMKIGYRF